jgi:hypothetical protein
MHRLYSLLRLVVGAIGLSLLLGLIFSAIYHPY